MSKDPICGMVVDTKKANKSSLTYTRKNKNYYFCSQQCLNKFAEMKRNHLLEIILSLGLILVAIVVYFKGIMLPFMGIVFLILSTLKLLDLKGFSKMFVQYDLVAAKSKLYARCYPFIELALAGMYLFAFQITYAAVITVLIMSVGAIGVSRNLLSKNKVKCACLGAKIKVPLTTFTLVEDLVMVGMGLIILFL
tara:strand:+ start:144 stop:725 length:582 start_codon:yes stop_codon:yes gene_type:complete